MTLLTNIENHAHKNADRIAIKIDKQQITYKALKDEIATKHYKLQQIEQQATVALNIQNPLTLIIYYLAVLQSNAIPCVIDYRWPQETKNKNNTVTSSYYGPKFRRYFTYWFYIRDHWFA
jgi:long-chain acyl-CoA synthetase